MTDTLLKVKGIDEVYVYCSDPAIKGYIPQGAVFLQRGAWLDGDEIKARDTYSAFVEEVDADIYVAACTTSPFTKVETVSDALEKVKSGGYDSAFSVKRAQTFAWYQGHPLNYDPADVPRTQDIEPVFVETSAFFIFKKELWTQHGRRIGFRPYMSEVDEIEAVDIDTPDEFAFADMIAAALNAEHAVSSEDSINLASAAGTTATGTV
jgi:CMP-N-acetylneuraminic acid synthetase